MSPQRDVFAHLYYCGFPRLLCPRALCGKVMTISLRRGVVMLLVAGDYISTLLCNVTQWSRNDDVTVHRVSTTAEGLQR